jgi:hypothetical protein
MGGWKYLRGRRRERSRSRGRLYRDVLQALRFHATCPTFSAAAPASGAGATCSLLSLDDLMMNRERRHQQSYDQNV